MEPTIYPFYPPQNPFDGKLDFSSPASPTSDLNLSVLQRHLPSTVAIDFVASYAVVYNYSTATQAWEKTGIEGTLFVLKLRDEGYAVLVLNRRGLDNFIIHLTGAEEVDVTPDYIILQENGGDVLGNGNADERKAYGLWIFEEQDGSTKGVREACARCIVECAEKAEKARWTGTVDGQSNGHAQQQPTAGPSSGPDLMALLNPPKG